MSLLPASSSSAHGPVSSTTTIMHAPSPTFAQDHFKPLDPSLNHHSQHDEDDDVDGDEGWDTAQEGEEPESEEVRREREARRILKGKAVEVVHIEEVIDSPPPHDDHSARLPHSDRPPYAVGTPTPPSSSHSLSSPNPSHHNADSDAPGPSLSTRRPFTAPESPMAFNGQTLLAPIPAVNVIPTSPPAHQRFMATDGSRVASGSLDIPHLNRLDSQESLRRRETVGPITPTSGRRSNRRRSLDPRTNANRLSGFFSHLLHMRGGNGSTNERFAESPQAEDDSSFDSRPTRHSFSAPPPRQSSRLSIDITPVDSPATPPPSLPRPRLRELGLQMTAITQSIPTSGPPLSGVFLAPHYLLLCHNQGLDVLPLVSPPAPQPYALIRRVAFKSVLIMEQRGVMVAIAGRREGIRVYALDEVKKAVEWRLQVEIEREMKEGHLHPAARVSMSIHSTAKSTSSGSLKDGTHHTSVSAQNSTSPVPHSPPPTYSSLGSSSSVSAAQVQLAQPMSPSTTSHLAPPSPSLASISVEESVPAGLAIPSRARGISVSTISALPPNMVQAGDDLKPTPEEGDAMPMEDEAKSEWMERRAVESDDEALDPVAAGPSASAALDERTSATAAAAVGITEDLPPPTIRRPSMSTTGRRGSRPPDLDLSASGSAPTLRSMRHALSFTGGPQQARFAPRSPRASTSLSLSGGDDANEARGTATPEVGEDFISFAQALAESRLPPATANAAASSGPTSPISPAAIRPPHPASAVINAIRGGATPTPSPPPPSVTPIPAIPKSLSQSEKKKRRRFSLMNGGLGGSSKTPSQPAGPIPRLPGPSRHFSAALPAASASTPNLIEAHPVTPLPPAPSTGGLQPPPIARSTSHSSMQTPLRPVQPMQTVDRIFSTQTDAVGPPLVRKSSHMPSPQPPASSSVAPTPSPAPSSAREQRRSSRFLPKLLTSFTKNHGDSKKSKEMPKKQTEVEKRLAAGGAMSANPPAPGTPQDEVPLVHAPAPKLEYVKLPGTKGAIAIKAVETPKKSFLAILCGDAGEKIELFAGTYKTALGLSRTFILPDSPKSLELQLQGDDLVELFLVFPQNVFGLEPATVRVREVRIGRAERRAARRRAREARAAEAAENASQMDDAHRSETIITTVVSAGGDDVRPRTSRSSFAVGEGNTNASGTPTELPDGALTAATQTVTVGPAPSPEELAAMAAAAQFGPYTTFQQLDFAPNFPLGSIADDFIIPPTYSDYLTYRRNHEPTAAPVSDLLAAPNTAAVLGPPVPPRPATPPPSRWFYIDPKGVTQGPWKASLMQTWFVDGFLPPNLPVRREEDEDFIPLKEMCASAADPEYPFRPPSTPLQPPVALDVPSILLSPISLLEQPRRFGPPALFFTSRGGHSTTIVDNRGKSVLRGRLNWTADDELTRLGDIRRLEAFDAGGRAVIVAMRQRGIEVLDVGDALEYPGDESRPALPYFHADPSGVSRRPNFMWKLGGTVGDESQQLPSDLPKSKRNATSHKKLNIGANGHSHTRPSSTKIDPSPNEDGEGPWEEEIMFLGRHGDTMYVCERDAGSFRILALGARHSRIH